MHRLDRLSEMRVRERIQQANAVAGLPRQMKSKRAKQHQVRQVPRREQAARPPVAHLAHQLCDAPAHGIAVVGLVEMDERRQRSEQRTRLQPVDLEAGSKEREAASILVHDDIPGTCVAEHVVRVDRSQCQVARQREGPAARQDDAISRDEPDGVDPVDRQPAGSGRHHMAFDRSRTIAEPDRPCAARVEAGGEIAFGFKDRKNIGQGIHGISGRWRRNGRRSDIARFNASGYLGQRPTGVFP